MSRQPSDAPPPLLPTDRVLLQAHRRAAQQRWPGLGAWLRAPRGGRGAAPVVIDADRLLPLLIAEALLAHQRAGLLRLMPSPEGLLAEPARAHMPWPPDSLEAALQRARPVPVAQLVADWRGGSAPSLDALARSAQRRGIVRVVATPRGTALEATPSALAAAAGQPRTLLVDDCRRQEPALWRSLNAAIADGTLLAPMPDVAPRPVVDPRAPAGVDRFGVPSDPVPGSALVTTVLIATVIVLGALAVARLGGALGPATLLGWWAWPWILGATSAVLLFAMARRPWGEDPLPPQGSPDEEEALAQRRRRRLARPRAPPALPWRLLGAAAMGVLVWMLTVLVTPLGVLAVALAGGWHNWHLRRWYRVQQLMPSPREVELAVARRSRELSARATDTAAAQAAPVAPATVPPRPRQWLTAADLPPPPAEALARTDRRRREAAAAVRRHAAGLLLYVGSLGAVAAGMVWDGRTPLLLVALCGAVWLVCLAWVPGRLLQALHRTRATSWQADRGITGLLLRACAALLPQVGGGRLARAGRALRRAVAAQPDFWRDDSLDLAAPLGASPRVLAGVTAALGLLLVAAGLLGTRSQLAAAGAILLALTLAFGWFLRREAARASVGQPGLRLVLLRVFGSPSFDDLLDWVRPWLLCGPVAHLEGHDSVVRSAEVREALALDRIDAVLVHSPEDLARRVAALPDRPDDNGRYRREAFQCTDAIWRSAIRTLLDRGDRVLMDLSSLGPSDLGCAYELGLLLDRVPLSRVLLLVDGSTDLACLQQVLDAAEQRIAPDSPNNATSVAPAAAWRLLHTGGAAVRQAGEPRADWLRRIDGRLDPLALVHFMLNGAGNDG